MGGKDPYSSSKACVELLLKSYRESYFNDNSTHNLVAARAGNVIGPFDFTKGRIVPDFFLADDKLTLRFPEAVRPWQHVLEPISGYLTLGEELLKTGLADGEAFNFGPRAEQNRTVTELLTTMADKWTADIPARPYTVTDNVPFKEAGLLKLNCDKALFYLKWDATLNYFQTVKMTAEWYSAYFADEATLFDVTTHQIEDYQAIARERKSSWVG